MKVALYARVSSDRQDIDLSITAQLKVMREYASCNVYVVVKEYADVLRNLLAKSSITEQRSFLKSFVERIEVDESEAKVYYTILMPPHSISEETVGVLPFIHHG